VRCLGIERYGLTDRGVESLAQSPQLDDLRELLLCNRGGIETGPLNAIGDEGALASEQWARRNAQAPGGAYCWIHTDYDERTITY
jgi:hypothetical protein